MAIRLFRRVLLSISLFATTGITLFLILSSPSPSWTIDIGTPGDTHFLRNAYLPEFSNDTSFRWTGPGSQLVLHSTNSEPVILDLRIYTDGNNSLFQCNQLRLEQFRKIITTFERQNGWRTYQILLAEGQVSGKKVIAQPLDLICDQYQTSYLDNRRLGVPIDWVRVRFLKPSFQSPTIISGIPIKRLIMLTFYLVLAFGIFLIFTQKKKHLAIITAITAVALMFWATYNPHTLSWVQRDLQVQTWILPIVLCSYVIVAVVLLWLYNQSKVDRLSISMRHLTYRIESYIVVAIIAIGSIFRFVHLLFVDLHLPFRLGGLYLEFARQIVKHRYMLPDRIPYYTDGGIPFAYPPLPFYIEAVLIDIFHFPVFLVVNLLPPVISVLSLVSFYILTRELKLELPVKVTALFAYALIPSAFMEQTEAAGLAESFGSLAVIWLMITLMRAERLRSTVAYSLVGLSWGVCIVASPGSAYASFLITVLFFALQLVRSQQEDWLSLIRCMSISTVIAMLSTSPYWLTVISNHGSGVFTNSFGAQHDGAFLGIIPTILESIFQHGFPGSGFWYISYLWGG